MFQATKFHFMNCPARGSFLHRIARPAGVYHKHCASPSVCSFKLLNRMVYFDQTAHSVYIFYIVRLLVCRMGTKLPKNATAASSPPQWPPPPPRLPNYVHHGSCALRSVDSQMQTSVFQLTRLITPFLVVLQS